MADHVQEDTIPAAMRPGLILLDAVLNSSEFIVENVVYLFCNQVKPSMMMAKTPPMPMTMPYPAPAGSTLMVCSATMAARFV